MLTLTATEARVRLFKLIDRVVATHSPVLITSRRANAVLVSEEDWRAIEETMNLLSIPGMRESIVEGLEAPIEECFDEVEW